MTEQKRRYRLELKQSVFGCQKHNTANKIWD